jgi:acyl-coenzyme A thioesterase PaaI-like protein
LHKIGKRLAVGDVLMYSDGETAPCARASVTYAIPSHRLDPPVD